MRYSFITGELGAAGLSDQVNADRRPFERGALLMRLVSGSACF